MYPCLIHVFISNLLHTHRHYQEESGDQETETRETHDDHAGGHVYPSTGDRHVLGSFEETTS